MFSSLVQVEEDAYVALGQIAASYERDETDFYLVKVDGEGNEIWSQTYGGRGMDIAEMVRQTVDGGFVLIGDRADEFVTDYYVYESNLVLIKTDAEGNEVWTQTYGDEILYLGWGVVQTPDGGYVLTGWEAKTIDDRDVIVIKTTEAGDVEWSRTWDLAPEYRDGGFDLILTSDGYIVIACIQAMGSGGPSAVLIKVDLEGNEIWKKLIGEEGIGNTFWDIVEDSDGGYVMVGDTHLGKVPTTGADIHGGLIVKTDTDGEILWQYIFGQGRYEQVSFGAAVVLPDGGYIFGGAVTRSGENYSDMLWVQVPAAPTAPAPTVISADTMDQMERLDTLSGHSDRVYGLDFSSDGRLLLSGGWDDTIRLWDATTWQELRVFNDHGGWEVFFAPDDAHVATEGGSVWDIASGEQVRRPDASNMHVTFSPDGDWMASAGYNAPIQLWDTASWQVVRTLPGHTDRVFGLAFSPDSALLASGSGLGPSDASDFTVKVWDVVRGEELRTLSGHGGDVHAVAFSPDGSLLASASTDGTVRVWEVASGQQLNSLRHGDGLYDVAFSPDGSLVAAAGCDRTVKLWDIEGGAMLRSLPHADEVMAVAFSPDGTLLASGCYDHQIYLWGVSR